MKGKLKGIRTRRILSKSLQLGPRTRDTLMGINVMLVTTHQGQP